MQPAEQKLTIFAEFHFITFLLCIVTKEWTAKVSAFRDE